MSETVFQRTSPGSGGLSSHFRRKRPAVTPAPEPALYTRPVIRPTTTPRDDLSITWKPYGNQDAGPEHAPCRLDRISDGCTLLTLRLRANPTVVGRIADGEADTEAAIQKDALASFQENPACRDFQSSRNDLATAQKRIAALEQKITNLDDEKARIETAPRGKGSRLLAIDSERTEAKAELESLQAEIEPLTRRCQRAEADVQAAAAATAQNASATAARNRQAELDKALADFATKHGDELTKILQLVSPPKHLNHDSRTRLLSRHLLDSLREPATLVSGGVSR